MKTATRLSVIRMCGVAGFCRAGYYRFLDPVKPAPADMDLRDQIQKIAPRKRTSGEFPRGTGECAAEVIVEACREIRASSEISIIGPP